MLDVEGWGDDGLHVGGWFGMVWCGVGCRRVVLVLDVGGWCGVGVGCRV